MAHLLDDHNNNLFQVFSNQRQQSTIYNNSIGIRREPHDLLDDMEGPQALPQPSQPRRNRPPLSGQIMANDSASLSSSSSLSSLSSSKTPPITSGAHVTGRQRRRATHLHIGYTSSDKRKQSTGNPYRNRLFSTTIFAESVSILSICICLSPLLLLSLSVRSISGVESIQLEPISIGTSSNTGQASSMSKADPKATSNTINGTTTTTTNDTTYGTTTSSSSSDTTKDTTTNNSMNSLSLSPGNEPIFTNINLPDVSRNSNTISVSALATSAFNPPGGADQAQSDEADLLLGIEITNSIIFVIGSCGNTIVIIVILKFTKIETVTDIYILNLAFADLMFIMGLLFLITTMHIGNWIFGNLMCKLYMATTSLNQFASSLLLVVMSFDRYLAVCHPIYAQRFRRPRRAKIICLTIWAVCLMLMTPIFVFAKISKELTCTISWPEYNNFNCEVVFTFYSFAIGFSVPLLLIAAFYIQVLRKLRVAATRPMNLGSSRRSKTRETTNKRVEHLVIGIIFTYTICWLPYWITQIYVSLSTLEPSNPFEGFYPFFLVATSLSYTNSALNPILYAFLSDNFKRRCSEIGRTISNIKWWQHSTSQSQSNHSTIITGWSEHSEASRPESRQTVLLNESSRLMVSPHRDKINNNNNGNQIGNKKRNKISDNNEKHDDGGQERHLESGLSLVVRSTLDPISGYEHDNNNNNCEINQNCSEHKDIQEQQTQRQFNGSIEMSSHSCQKGNQERLNENNLNILDVCSNFNEGHRKKSVNFSVDTVVVQDLNNNETMKGNHHMILQVDSNNNNQCQGV